MLASWPSSSSMTRRSPGLGEDGGRGRRGLGEGIGDGHALAGGEAVGLEDDRGALQIGPGVGGVGVGEGPAGGGRGAAGGADLLGEGLGGLEAGGLAAGAEGGDAGLAQDVGDALGEQGLGAYHNEINGVFGAEGGEDVAVEDVERHAGRLLGDAGVAGGAPEPVDLRVLGECPRERMLAAAAAEDEDVHSPLRRDRGRLLEGVAEDRKLRRVGGLMRSEGKRAIAMVKAISFDAHIMHGACTGHMLRRRRDGSVNGRAPLVSPGGAMSPP